MLGNEPQVPGSGRVHVLLVDDQHLVRDAIATLIGTALGHEVTQASSGTEALVALASRRVDVILLDIRMPRLDGVSTLREIRRVAPDVPVVMLSSYAQPAEVTDILEAGASGYLIKAATPGQLQEAIDIAVARRGVYVHPVVQEHLLREARHLRALPELTPRERMILARAASGETNAEIGAALSISRKTVKAHLSQIFRKLDCANRTEAVARAIREGMIGDVQGPR